MESEKKNLQAFFVFQYKNITDEKKSYYVFVLFFWEIKMCSEPDTIGIFKINIHPKVKFIYFFEFFLFLIDCSNFFLIKKVVLFEPFSMEKFRRIHFLKLGSKKSTQMGKKFEFLLLFFLVY